MNAYPWEVLEEIGYTHHLTVWFHTMSGPWMVHHPLMGEAGWYSTRGQIARWGEGFGRRPNPGGRIISKSKGVPPSNWAVWGKRQPCV